MRALCLGLALSAGVVMAQPGIGTPHLGWASCAGEFRPVLGLAANFVLGDSVAGSVASSAFSGAAGIVKTDASLQVLDRAGGVVFQMDAEPGPALFAFSEDGSPALVYLIAPQTLLRWTTDHFEDTALAFNGRVAAIGTSSVVLQRDDGLWLLDLSNGSETALAGVSAPVLLRADGSAIYSDGQSIILRASDGTERRVESGIQVAAFEPMDRQWVHVTERDSARHFALRLEPGREQLFQLPEAP